MSLDSEVRAAYDAGLCVIPVRSDGSKRPAVSTWKEFKTERPPISKFKFRHGLGIVAGPVSGHIEAWDFDNPDAFEQFCEKADAEGLGDLLLRIRTGYEDRTPKDGRRWLVHYPESVEWKDCTLAQAADKKVLIELPTFVILAPSGGPVHPSGKPYTRAAGGFASIASYTEDERAALIKLAQSFDQSGQTRTTERKRGATLMPPPPWRAAYNDSLTWPELLEPHGWTRIRTRNDGTEEWARPGKPAGEGLSATINAPGYADRLYVFTTSTELEKGFSYDRFAVNVALNFGGDFVAAKSSLPPSSLKSERSIYINNRSNTSSFKGGKGRKGGKSNKDGDQIVHPNPPLPPSGSNLPPAGSIPVQSLDEYTRLRAEALADLNKQFAVVEVGFHVTQPVIARFNPDTEDLVSYTTFKNFKDAGILFPEAQVPDFDPVKNVIKKIPRREFWLKQPERRYYSRMQFVPPGSSEVVEAGAYNRWRGLAVEPKAGKWTRIRAHMHDVICAGHDDSFAWLFNWIASMVQKPGQQGQTAPLLKSGQGTGKGMFVQIVASLLRRDNFLHITQPDELIGAFNSHLSGKVFVFVDEAFFGSPQAAQSLKTLITERTLTIKEKYLPNRSESNCLHLILATNANRPLRIEHDDRRFVVLDVDESQKNDPAYFDQLLAAVENGEREAFLHALLAHDVNEDMLKRPPDTHAKQQLRADSADPETHWWSEYLTPPSKYGWSERQLKTDVHESFTRWFQARRQVGAIPSMQRLGSFLARHFKDGGMPSWPMATKIVGQQAWRFPALDVCREVFVKATGFTPDGWS